MENISQVSLSEHGFAPCRPSVRRRNERRACMPYGDYPIPNPQRLEACASPCCAARLSGYRHWYFFHSGDCRDNHQGGLSPEPYYNDTCPNKGTAPKPALGVVPIREEQERLQPRHIGKQAPDGSQERQANHLLVQLCFITENSHFTIKTTNATIRIQ